MALTPQERFKIILSIPKNATVYEQIRFLGEHGLTLADTDWGFPSGNTQASMQAEKKFSESIADSLRQSPVPAMPKRILHEQKRNRS